MLTMMPMPASMTVSTAIPSRIHCSLSDDALEQIGNDADGHHGLGHLAVVDHVWPPVRSSRSATSLGTQTRTAVIFRARLRSVFLRFSVFAGGLCLVLLCFSCDSSSA